MLSPIILYFVIVLIQNWFSDLQDKAINKTNIHTKIGQIEEDLSSQIQKSKENLAKLKNLTFESFPGLSERILKDKTKQTYSRNKYSYKP